MKGKSLLAGVAIVLLALASGLGWYLGNQQKLEAASYGFIHEQADQLVVNFGQTLVWLNAYGEEQAAVNFSDLGIQAEGDFEFFANGDLLVYHRATKPSLWKNIKRYHRVKEHAVEKPVASDGFYRCQLDIRRCQRFGVSLPAINGSFRLAVDTRDDSVYLAHTAAFKLYKIGSTGGILAESDSTNFKFPNQLWFANDQLWVADTNNHRLAQLSVKTERFAEVEQEFNTSLDRRHRWPHQFASNGETFWVNIADGGMANGRIGIYSRDGKAQGELTAAQGKDPIAVYWWQDVLWLADFSEPLLERISTEGDVLADVSAPTLERLAAQSDGQKIAGAKLSQLGGIAFVVVMLLGFTAAWLLERQQTVAALTGQDTEALKESVAKPVKEHVTSEVFWISNQFLAKSRYMKWLFIALPILMLSSFVLLAIEVANDESASLKIEDLSIWAAVVICLSFIMYSSYRMMQRIALQKIGVIGASLVLQNSDRSSTVARAENIFYNDNYLLADDIIISLGNKRQRIFSDEELNDWVFPRLKLATPISRIAVLKKMWSIKDPFIISGAVMLVVMIAMAIVIEFAGKS